MSNHEILQKTKLLDATGNVAEPGWCRKNLYEYKRKDIKANPTRIKEWDFYQISDDRYTIQVTIADISLGGAVTVGIFDRKTGLRADAISLSLFTFGRMHLSEVADNPNLIRRKMLGFDFTLESTPISKRMRLETISTRGPLKLDIEMAIKPGQEYLTMAVPFDEDKHFYLNQKQNCMACRGGVKVGNTFSFILDPKKAFCVMDWGRGVWPHHETWYWGNGSMWLDGKLFGFEIGWGFGNMSAASENCLFYDGKAHKIGNISLNKSDRIWLGQWVFTSDDGRFEMTMTPEYDNYSNLGIPYVFGMKCHQVHGKWDGYVILDDGTKLEIHDMNAFCENADNRW